jgi:hypothetical protein
MSVIRKILAHIAKLLRAAPPQPLPDEREQEYLDRQW